MKLWPRIPRMARRGGDLTTSTDTICASRTPSVRPEILALAAMFAAASLSAVILLHSPAPHDAAPFFATIGFIALWRYGWWATHLCRSVLYLRRRFPRIRAAADEAARRGPARRVHALVMSYEVDPKVFETVYDGLLRACLRYGAEATIVAGITRALDRAALEALHARHGSPARIEIVAQYQDGSGKRSAMAEALRAISRRAPAPDEPVIFLDGDILLPEDALERTIPLLQADPSLAAITTNNDAKVEGGPVTREWYRLRYAQRHILMASMSLSDRLLVLTGRFSIYRARHAVDPEFIARIERDEVHHWRHGSLRLVSGDDKSTWWELYRRGERMLYVPDVTATGFEALPKGASFVSGSGALMKRWFGNMLRTNGRAIALGPRRNGPFIWWCLVDQRLSMWTSMVGPVSTAIFAAFVSIQYLFYYILWIMGTRFIASAVCGIAWRRWSALWPLLLYYNQIGGSLIKIFVSFRTDRQGWTRQRIGGAARPTLRIRWTTRLLNASAAFALVMGVAVGTGNLTLVAGGDALNLMKTIFAQFLGR